MFLAPALLTFFVSSLDAQTRSVTIAWDPSPDPSVIAYVVYVGNEPGAPRERFYVNGTLFVYSNVSGDRPYFFSVASADDHQVGPRSAEILFLAGGAVFPNAARDVTVSSTSAGTTAAPPAAPVAHRELPASRSACTQSQQCYEVVGSIGDFGRIDAVSALGDGRLILIENGARILILHGDDGDTRSLAAAAVDGVRFDSVLVDPRFSATHFVYVAENETLSDGTSHVNIARYREVNGTLGERAVVVAALPGSPEKRAAMALDASGHLFVALPSSASSTNYAGMILRFFTDGGVPADNHAASPVYARGASAPVQLVWSAATNSLWLSDRDAQRDASLLRIPLEGGAAEWPRTPDVISVGSASFEIAAPVSIVDGDPGRLIAINEDVYGLAQAMVMDPAVFAGEPRASAQNRDEIDVAVQNVDGLSVTGRIVRLRFFSPAR